MPLRPFNREQGWLLPPTLGQLIGAERGAADALSAHQTAPSPSPPHHFLRPRLSQHPLLMRRARSPRGPAFFPKLFTAVYIMFPHFTSLSLSIWKSSVALAESSIWRCVSTPCPPLSHPPHALEGNASCPPLSRPPSLNQPSEGEKAKDDDAEQAQWRHGAAGVQA